MKPTISLLFGVHAHQPVGNFTEVLDDAQRRCYGPFIRTLYRYPRFRFAAHFSGWLLDYLLRVYPEDMALLKQMVARGQLEMVGAGDTEPVLAAIPYRDRMSQLNALSERLHAAFGQRPQGAWLTERVWEATVVPALADAGIGYVTVDDYHFLCAGQDADKLNGFFTTEEDGRRLDLYPISEALRYRLPFAPAHEAVAHIESLAKTGEAAAIYFDDIEKFGIWPETYAWVFEKGWLTQFIEGVLASQIIRTETFSAHHARAKTHGVVYLPTTSYIEMNEWTLPAHVAARYDGLIAASKASGRFESEKAFLRGGIWKNFFSVYPESNWMHKRMLSLSQRLQTLPAEQASERMRVLLHEAQANDAYWHGLFGGLYLPHLRRAVYNAIVELEGLLDSTIPRPAVLRADTDMDGNDEIFLHNSALQAVVRLDGSASVIELDAYRLRHNFGDTLRRQPEHYHHKTLVNDPGAAHHGDGINSAHDRISFKHIVTQDDLTYDAAGRTLFRDTLHDVDEGAIALDYVLRASTEDKLSFVAQTRAGALHKHIAMLDGQLKVTYQFPKKLHGQFITEINLAMPSCDGPAGRFVLQGEIPGGFGQPLTVEVLDQISVEDAVLGGSLSLDVSPPARFAAQPLFTVSQSEAGFEKIMQAVTLQLDWQLPTVENQLELSLLISPA
ncbi:4-alpha-glucanotransferase [Sulfuriferula plumbiphila]|uniref:4-alpha-glucanotransferase n=1 Tax=Sulfuriferula plumbiphila TaxID=171865 RepID=A0A512LC72_9PROT|nr:alpha-amylase/4-alpha-glucanotransferase domain-containing protein [Sulfuriferula plumbiphila]BBP04066.1 4-alpha-glucanotransferase [Sulfuriferula plumbiphila]GEP32090.1 4-alpha-glucanotransferase [Sulfuriferula plumbiphila]